MFTVFLMKRQHGLSGWTVHTEWNTTAIQDIRIDAELGSSSYDYVHEVYPWLSNIYKNGLGRVIVYDANLDVVSPTARECHEIKDDGDWAVLLLKYPKSDAS